MVRRRRAVRTGASTAARPRLSVVVLVKSEIRLTVQFFGRHRSADANTASYLNAASALLLGGARTLRYYNGRRSQPTLLERSASSTMCRFC
jgi:hypothetical protein